MPTYAYTCTACDHSFEVQQSFSDASLTECPECSGRLRKLYNAVGIVFKGSGFYRTDSRGGTGKNGSSALPAKGGGSSESSSSGTSSSSTSGSSSAGSSSSSGSSSSGSSSASSSSSSSSPSSSGSAA